MLNVVSPDWRVSTSPTRTARVGRCGFSSNLNTGTLASGSSLLVSITNRTAYRKVEETGIHLDIHHPDGTQLRKLDHWPPQPSNVAMGQAEAFLRANAQRYVRRFEKWL